MTTYSPRVYGSMLGHLLDKNISIIGKVVNVLNGKFILESTDSTLVNVFTDFKTYVDDVVEVVGISKHSGVEALQIIHFNKQMWNVFDQVKYNIAIQHTGNEMDYFQSEDF